MHLPGFQPGEFALPVGTHAVVFLATVIQDLDLHAVLKRSASVGDPNPDSIVPTLGEFEFEIQHEISVFLFGLENLGSFLTHEHTVFHDVAFRVAGPTREIFAVKQGFPIVVTGKNFESSRSRNLVGIRLCGLVLSVSHHESESQNSGGERGNEMTGSHIWNSPFPVSFYNDAHAEGPGMTEDRARRFPEKIALDIKYCNFHKIRGS